MKRSVGLTTCVFEQDQRVEAYKSQTPAATKQLTMLWFGPWTIGPDAGDGLTQPFFRNGRNRNTTSFVSTAKRPGVFSMLSPKD
jgi:hypothetical protein